jgi:hypothetical protein
MIATRSLSRGLGLGGLLLSVTIVTGGWGLPASGAMTVSEANQSGRVILAKSDDGENAGLGVNAYLWRASLDTVSFMPLATVDPLGGVIITDWYANPQTPEERFKMTVYIFDKRMRADGVKVAVFRQVRQGKSDWVDAQTNPETATKLENAILTRARQFRVDAGH